jgi:hypothetical protein
MLTALALAGILGFAGLLAMGMTWLVDSVDRRRARRIAAQVRVTDAIHGVLGAIVAPTVERSTANRWTVSMRLGPRERAAAGRLSEIVRQTLGQDGARVRVVFTPRV